jgi:hypothetical protein
MFLLFVHPAHARRGLGRTLLGAAHDALRDAGCREAFLFAHEENKRALDVYAAAGYRWDGSDRVSDFRGTRVRELRLVKPLEVGSIATCSLDLRSRIATSAAAISATAAVSPAVSSNDCANASRAATSRSLPGEPGICSATATAPARVLRAASARSGVREGGSVSAR